QRGGEDSLATRDDGLVRDRVVAPRRPGAGQHTEQVEDAEGLGSLRALGAELAGGVEGVATVEAASQEDVASRVARVTALGLADRVERAVVGAREDRGSVAAGARAVVASELRQRRAARLAMPGQAARHGHPA